MKHDVLGEIEKHSGDPFDGTAVVQYDSRDIRVGLICDDQPFEATVKLAAEVVGRLSELDLRAKQVAAAELCETYNAGWNSYDEVQEDGSLKSITNPQLTEDEFIVKLSLSAINITGDSMIDFYYDDQNMFWGHSVIVQSFNGTDLSEAHAELFG